MTGNWFAAFAILAWPLVAIALYRTRPVAEATLWTILGAFLLLPAGVSLKIAMIPALDKNSVPGVCALIGVLSGPRLRRASPGWGMAEIFMLALVFCPLITSALNNDAIVVGDTVLPGVGYYDGISALLSQFFVFLPFFVGRRVFREAEDIEMLIRALTIAGLFYAWLMLFEIRMSPHLANWIYGYFPSTFSSEGRYGGFRPVVFMINGLAAAFFLMTTFLSALALWRVGRRFPPLSPGIPAAFLGVVLILCKSAGALVYAIVGGSFIRWLKPQAQIGLAVLLVFVGVLYPILRITDVFPDRLLVETAAEFDEERAQSLGVRFYQERQLLDRASERFVFGWGRYGRNRVHENSGKDSSITDGAWIIILGEFGIVGFLAQFGLLALPALRAASAFKFLKSQADQIFFSTLALIVALDLIEQLPNSSISAWVWLLAGVLLGRSEQVLWSARKARRKPTLEAKLPTEAGLTGAAFQGGR